MEILPHQQRVIDEKAELDKKHEALVKFRKESPIFANLPFDEQLLLVHQSCLMAQYSSVLGERIAKFGLG